MKNPFEFGRELAPDELVDREAEVRQVTTAMLDGRKLFVIGPRRFGKTSILRAAEAKAQGDGAVVLRFDAEAYPTISDLVEAILARAAGRLVGPVEKAPDRIARVFGSLRPEVAFNPIDQTWTLSLGPRAAQEPPVRLLVEALGAVEALAADSDRPVALVIDEFQHVLQTGGEAAERQIRAAVQTHRHVAYVFAGSATRLLGKMTGDPSRPFYRLGSRLFVGPIPEEEFREFLRERFTSGEFTLAGDALEELLRRSEGVPYNVQRLAHGCWDALVEAGETELTGSGVREALELGVRRDDPFYTQVWTGLTAVQRTALVAVVRHGGAGLYAKAVLDEAGLTPSGLHAALGALDRGGVLRGEPHEGVTRWHLEDPFLGAWIRMVVPDTNPERTSAGDKAP